MHDTDIKLDKEFIKELLEDIKELENDNKKMNEEIHHRITRFVDMFFVVLLVFKLANLVDISWAVFIGIFVLNVVGYAFYKLCVVIIKHSIKKDIEWLSKYQEK
jgi:hypothetical protein